MGSEQVIIYQGKREDDESDFRISPYLLFRIAGLGLSNYSELISVNSMKYLEEKYELETSVTQHAEYLTMQLYNAVSICSDENMKKKLLKVKKSFGKKKVPQVDDLLDVIEWTQADKTINKGLITEYLAQQEQLARLKDKEEQYLLADYQRETEFITNLVKTDVMQNGLLLSSSSLYQKLISYLKQEIKPQNRANRKFESSLIRYITRTLFKTSPFSTFTPISFASVSPVEQSINIKESQKQLKSYCYINPNILKRVIRLLEKKFTNKLLIVINPSLQIDSENYYIPTVKFTSLSTLLDRYTQTILKIKRQPMLDYLYQHMGELPITHEEVIKFLIDFQGANADEQKIRQFIANLSEINFFQSGFLLDDYDQNLIPNFIKAVEKLNLSSNQLLSNVIAILEHIDVLTNSYIKSKPKERLLLLKQISSSVVQLFDACGERCEVPEFPILEDAFYQDLNIKFNLNDSSTIYQDLKFISNSIGLYDVFYGYKLTLKEFFVRNYGKGGVCKNIFVLSKEWFDFASKELPREPTKIRGFMLTWNPFNLQTIKLWQQARRNLRKFIFQYANASTDEIDLKEILTSVAGDVTRNQGNMSLDFTGQLFIQNNKDRFVVNNIHDGWGHMFSRFLFPNNTETEGIIKGIQAQNTNISQEEVVADIRGYYGFPADIRPNLTKSYILYPGSTQFGEINGRNTVGDLEVRHDVNTDRLRVWSSKQKKYISPRFLGFYNLFSLPNFGMFLSLMESSNRATLHPFELFDDKINDKLKAEGYLVIPRFSVGSVVLSRKTWLISNEKFPRRKPGMTDIEYMDYLNQWRNQLGLAPYFFVRVARYAENYEEMFNGASYKDAERKPQYIDLRVHLLIREFERYLNRGHIALEIEEMLPDHQSIFPLFEEPHVNEMVIEVHQWPKEKEEA
ncbi:lantibiotic dehydratase [Bacillus cereus]|uniref:lantibiotic dehydratase n=1 Tax=Bacillus cereus TaxID=1396 RepID=UPI001596AE04|nr:lantibiotic dehydratase [Bacillus cereus]